jgi:hypothetical protein
VLTIVRDDAVCRRLMTAPGVANNGNPGIDLLRYDSTAFASSQGARIQTARSSSVRRITRIAFEWIGLTTAFGNVVRTP